LSKGRITISPARGSLRKGFSRFSPESARGRLPVLVEVRVYVAGALALGKGMTSERIFAIRRFLASVLQGNRSRFDQRAVRKHVARVRKELAEWVSG